MEGLGIVKKGNDKNINMILEIQEIHFVELLIFFG